MQEADYVIHISDDNADTSDTMSRGYVVSCENSTQITQTSVTEKRRQQVMFRFASLVCRRQSSDSRVNCYCKSLCSNFTGWAKKPDCFYTYFFFLFLFSQDEIQIPHCKGHQSKITKKKSTRTVSNCHRNAMFTRSDRRSDDRAV